MSSETSPQPLKITSSQFGKALGSTPMCFVLPESTAGEVFLPFLWVLHHIFTPTASQKLIHKSSFFVSFQSNIPKHKKRSLCTDSIAKTSKIFHQEAPNPTSNISQACRSAARVFSGWRAAPRSVGVLSVKGNLDALDLVTQFDGGAELQVHTLLHCGQS